MAAIGLLAFLFPFVALQVTCAAGVGEQEEDCHQLAADYDADCK
jgi:hypothetical protein